MATEVFMPKAGMDMREGTIIRWLANEGDTVVKGDALLVIETDKVTMEVESPADGILLKKYFGDGAVVPVVTIIGYVGRPGEKVPDQPSMAGGKERAEEEAMLAGAEAAEDEQNAFEYKVAVIGGGPAGYTAAMRASSLGARTVLFEKNTVGGVGIAAGCVPLKSLIGAAESLRSVRRAESAGFLPADSAVSFDFDRVCREKDRIVREAERYVSERLKERGVEVIHGEALLIGHHHIRAGVRTYRAENIIFCPGSHPARLGVPGEDLDGVVNIEEFLAENAMPERLVIIGGGVSGCETASAFRTFGAEVTVAESRGRILPTFDRDVSAAVAEKFKEAGIRILTGVRVRRFEATGESFSAVLDTGEKLEGDRILVCVGRKPNIESLGTLKDETEFERGKIVVDDYCRTSLADVYACGDVTNWSILAHSALKMGETAADNACGRTKEIGLKRAPLCLYTDPEAAGIGLTEDEARRRGEIMVGRVPFSENIRAVTERETDGFVKVIADKAYGEILGVHIVGKNATELIVEAKTMMDMEITVYEVADIMHPHPTRSETFKAACAAAAGEKILSGGTRSFDDQEPVIYG